MAETLSRDLVYANVPEGFDALVLLRRLRDAAADGRPGTIVHIARDDRRLDALERTLAFYAPKTRVVSIPAWDTVPYDRVGPNTEILASRLTGLVRLALGVGKEDRKSVV